MSLSPADFGPAIGVAIATAMTCVAVILRNNKKHRMDNPKPEPKPEPKPAPPPQVSAPPPPKDDRPSEEILRQTKAEIEKIHKRVQAHRPFPDGKPKSASRNTARRLRTPANRPRSEYENSVNRGWVYVVGNDGSRALKIGKSKNGVNSRIRTWQTSSPHKFKKHFEIEVSDMHDLEKLVHVRLKRHRGRGEWFNVTPVEAASALKAVMKRRGIVVLREVIINQDIRTFGIYDD